MRIYELRQKEVVNIKDGAKFGYIADLEFDKDGKIEKLIIPGPAKVFGIFGRDSEYQIPWGKVKQMGGDVILVDIDLDDCIEEI